MYDTVVKMYGDAVTSQVYTNPKRACDMLTAAYSVFAFKNNHFPIKEIPPARSYIASAISSSIAQSLKEPDKSAIVSIFQPCEILHAMDIIPMFPEALSVYVASTSCEQIFIETAEQNNIPETFCSYHKVLLGLAQSDVLPKPLMVASSSIACDANQLTFPYLANHYDIPHIAVDVPYTKDENDKNAIQYVVAQLKKLTAALEQTTGKKLDYLKLQEAVARSNRSIQMHKEYLDLRATRSVDDETSSELFSLCANNVYLGTEETEKFNEMLIEDIQTIPDGYRDGRKRILWMHTTPQWDSDTKALFEVGGKCEIVASDMGFNGLIDMDPENPYESMAKRMLSNIANGSGNRRIETALEYAKKMDIDGIIFFCHWGCKHTIGLSSLAKETFEKNGFPTLILDGDGCDSSNVSQGQMSTRINAFLEQLGAL